MNLRSGLTYGAAFLVAGCLHVGGFVALGGLIRPGAGSPVEPRPPLYEQTLAVSFRRPEAVPLQPEPSRPVTRLREPDVRGPERPPAAAEPSEPVEASQPVEQPEEPWESPAGAQQPGLRGQDTQLSEVPATASVSRPPAGPAPQPVALPPLREQKPWPLRPIDAEALYPLGARLRGEQGVVRLTVRVGTDGRVEELAIDESSGFRVLDQAAERAVRRTRFAPATRDQQPVVGELSIAIRFRLDS